MNWSIIVEFAVAGLEDVGWDQTPFERLELTQEKKRIIKALVQSVESEQDAAFDDFASGKGKGIISLLQYGWIIVLPCTLGSLLTGPAESRKTLNTEGRFESFRKPLYFVWFTNGLVPIADMQRICAGELSNGPEKLEDSVGKVLHLASH